MTHFDTGVGIADVDRVTCLIRHKTVYSIAKQNTHPGYLLPPSRPLWLSLVLCPSDTMPLIKVSSGLKMHYIVPSSPDPNKPYIDPSRPTIVMLHPRFFDSHFFAPQFRDGRLTKAYNVIAIDHHYHGQTEAPLDSKPYDFDLVSYAGPPRETASNSIKLRWPRLS